MTTPDPATEHSAGIGQEEFNELLLAALKDPGVAHAVATAAAKNSELFRSLIADALESPGYRLEDLTAAAAENSALRRAHHGQPPGHYARRT